MPLPPRLSRDEYDPSCRPVQLRVAAVAVPFGAVAVLVFAAIAVSCLAGAAVAGLIASEVRSSGNPMANAVAFRRPPPRMGLFPVGFTCDYTFHEERTGHVAGPGQLGPHKRFTGFVTR